MKRLSIEKLADIVKTSREALNLTQIQLSDQTGLNRATIGRTLFELR